MNKPSNIEKTFEITVNKFKLIKITDLYIHKGFFLQSHVCSCIYQLKRMKNVIYFITWCVYRIQV